MDAIITPPAIISYPKLFTAVLGKNPKPGAQAKFSSAFIFPAGTDYSMLTNAAFQCGLDKYGQQFGALVQQRKVHWPFRAGEEKDYPAGSVFIHASTTSRPGVVDQMRQVITDPELVYPGCWVRASVRPFTFEADGKRGVTWGLNNVQFLGHGTRLDNRKAAEEEFDDVQVDPSQMPWANTGAPPAALPPGNADLMGGAPGQPPVGYPGMPQAPAPGYGQPQYGAPAAPMGYPPVQAPQYGQQQPAVNPAAALPSWMRS